MDLTLHVLIGEDRVPRRRLPSFLSAIRKGGASVVQVREKGRPFADAVAYGQAVAFVAEEVGLLLAVNDDPELALALGANILHLGKDDLNPGQSLLLAPKTALGLSARNLGELSWALSNHPAYIGYGPVFPTGSKGDAGPAQGLEKLGEAVQQAGDVPIVAIGGIRQGNAASVWAAGVRGIAVISAIDPSGDTVSQVRALLESRGSAQSGA